MAKVRFRINYETSKQEAFEQFLQAFESRIGFELQQLDIERYWKFPEQLQANFIIHTKAKSLETRTYEILKFANKLSEEVQFGWTFNGPHDKLGFVFECFFNNREHPHPLKWAMIEAENDA